MEEIERELVMVSGDTVLYRNIRIYKNDFGEYCVLDKNGEMVEFNSAFKNLSCAKKFIEEIYENNRYNNL